LTAGSEEQAFSTWDFRITAPLTGLAFFLIELTVGRVSL
jgi:hypothetical protein